MQELIEQARNTSVAEAVAALLGLAYLLFAVKRSLLCWLCAFISTSIYLVLFAKAALYMQAALQVFYLAMAVYGFIDWKKGRTEEAGVLIRTWSAQQHVLATISVACATVLNGWLLAKHTDAVAPYLDSFVTWASVITTWMVARRVLENWLYWVIVDAIAAYLYFTQNLLATTALFVIYIGIVIHGFFVWRRQHREQVRAGQLNVTA